VAAFFFERDIMKEVEKIFGPVGALKVNLDSGAILCRNGLTGAHSVFYTDFETASKVQNWIEQGKKENIQDIAPQLDADRREMCISGIFPGDWDEYVGG
jgi:hypothetical protein